MKALAAALILCAGQAGALSCMAPDAREMFGRAQAAEAQYVALLGTATFDGSTLHGFVNEGEPEPRQVQGTFEGMRLTEAGFDTPLEAEVTIAQTCVGPWCGGLPAGELLLAFAEITPEGLVITAAPCGSWALVDPTEADIATVEACMAQGDCLP